MRWFTDALRTSSESEDRRVVQDYLRHIASLAPSLPKGFRALAEAGGSISLHDGQVLGVFFEEDPDDTLVVDVYTGEDHPPAGPLISVLHVRIVYRGAELVAPTLSEMRRLIRSPKTAILDGEVERLSDGRLEHRMSLWTDKHAPLRVAIIRFDDAEVVPVRFQGTVVTVVDCPPAIG